VPGVSSAHGSARQVSCRSIEYNFVLHVAIDTRRHARRRHDAGEKARGGDARAARGQAGSAERAAAFGVPMDALEREKL
jgi:hypothetical protein